MCVQANMCECIHVRDREKDLPSPFSLLAGKVHLSARFVKKNSENLRIEKQIGISVNGNFFLILPSFFIVL